MLTHSASFGSDLATDYSGDSSKPVTDRPRRRTERINRPASKPAPAIADLEAAPAPAQPTGYAPRKRDPKVLSVVIGLHLIVALAMVIAPQAVQKMAPVARLKTFDIAPPPPPPQAQPEPTPRVPAPRMATPPPVVQLPLPSPVMVAPELPPVTVPAPPAPTAPVASTAPAQTAPAPVTPPDFNAAQLRNPAPAYPFASRRAHEEGVVLLKVLVTEQGRPSEIRLAESSGHARLDDAALQTVQRWKFVPARQAGKPVRAWVLVPVTFSLR